MGYYINPIDGTSKEAWLEEHGQLVSAGTIKNKEYDISKEFPVCLVDNGSFRAAGIAYCHEEAEVFLHPDGRPRDWYLVTRELLKPYCSLA